MQERDRIQEILEKIPGFTLRHYHSGENDGRGFHFFHFYVSNDETLKRMLRLAARHNFQTLIWLEDSEEKSIRDRYVYTFGIPMFGGAASFIEEAYQ